MRVYCNYCGRSLSRSARDIKRYKHHFCNRDHYYKFRKIMQRHRSKPKNMSAQNKIKTLAAKIASIKVGNG